MGDARAAATSAQRRPRAANGVRLHRLAQHTPAHLGEAGAAPRACTRASSESTAQGVNSRVSRAKLRAAALAARRECAASSMRAGAARGAHARTCGGSSRGSSILTVLSTRCSSSSSPSSRSQRSPNSTLPRLRLALPLPTPPRSRAPLVVEGGHLPPLRTRQAVAASRRRAAPRAQLLLECDVQPRVRLDDNSCATHQKLHESRRSRTPTFAPGRQWYHPTVSSAAGVSSERVKGGERVRELDREDASAGGTVLRGSVEDVGCSAFEDAVRRLRTQHAFGRSDASEELSRVEEARARGEHRQVGVV